MPIDTYQYQIPLDQQNVKQTDEFAPGYYPRPEFEATQQVDLSARDIEEQATPESVRDGLIDLYDDRSNLDYLQNENIEPARRSEVSPIVENRYADEQSEEEKMHKIIEQMPLLEQTKMIISTGSYIVNIVRADALEMSRIER